jgi:hypothetical protein
MITLISHTVTHCDDLTDSDLDISNNDDDEPNLDPLIR